MKIGYLYIFLATLLFSSMEVALKFVASDFHPMQLNCTRFLAGGLLLIPFALVSLKKRRLSVSGRDMLSFAFLGFIGLVVSMQFYQFSILYAPASVISVLFSCNPVLVYLFAFLILRSDIRPAHIAALILEVGAAFLIIDRPDAHLDPRGIILVLISAALFALYAVLGKKQTARFSGVTVTCFAALCGGFETLLLIGLSSVPTISSALSSAGLGTFADIPLLAGYRPDNILPMLYICIGVTAGGYAFHFMGIEATSAVEGSLVFFFKPVLAPILAMLVLGDVISPKMWLGIGVMLLASFVSMIPSIRDLMAVRHGMEVAGGSRKK